MEFIYKSAHLPKKHELLRHINSAASRLFHKLKHLDVDSLHISHYNKRYLGDHLRNIHSTLQRYSYILSWSVAHSNTPLNKFVFLDYGGGSGILSLLAKELKIGTVIYNDCYDVSCKDATIIAESIKNQADYYVLGDIDDVLRFFRAKNINCNSVASNDVIEHIYDIDSFCKKMPCLSGGQLTVVMSSGANMLHPLIRRTEMRKQRELEYKDRDKTWGHKERDCVRAYRNVRREIIVKHLEHLDKRLTQNEVEQLTNKTRGLIEADIRECVNEYVRTGKFPHDPSHPTNTCDPCTGNWAEHLMDPNYLANMLSQEGFRVEILSGNYGRSQSIAKRFIGGVLNACIYRFKKQGIRLAPFYTVYGIRE